MRTKFLIPVSHITREEDVEKIKKYLKEEENTYGLEYDEQEEMLSKVINKKISLKEKDKVYFFGCLVVKYKFYFIDEDIMEYTMKKE